MQEQVITGDALGEKNGYEYKVSGKDDKCGLTDTTWMQINTKNKAKRKIFRFDSDSIEF